MECFILLSIFLSTVTRKILHCMGYNFAHIFINVVFSQDP